MVDCVTKALRRILHGAGIVVVGTLIGMFFKFATKILLARSFERSQYGTLSLTFTVLSIALTVSLLGISKGLPREVARFKATRKNLEPLVFSGLLLGVASSLVASTALYLLAPLLGEYMDDPNLPLALRLVSISLPFGAVIKILISVSRGLGRLREKLYYAHIVQPSVYLLSLGAMVLLNVINIEGVILGYVLSLTVTSLLLLRDMSRNMLIRTAFNIRTATALLLFSVPLMFKGILGYVMNWTDTLMVGHYLGPDAVGLYHAATPLARLLLIPISAMGFLFVPLATELYAEGKGKALLRLYVLVTRWIYMLSFPIFITLFVFPGSVISFVMGKNYEGAASALRLLALGFMIHNALGPNGLTLVSIGRPLSTFAFTGIAAVVNVALNMALIPTYGITGAAAATATSYVAVNLLRSWWLYKNSGVHPFTPDYIKMVTAGVVLLSVGLVMGRVGVSPVATMGVLLVAYIVVITGLGCVGKEDWELIQGTFEEIRGLIRRLMGR